MPRLAARDLVGVEVQAVCRAEPAAAPELGHGGRNIEDSERHIVRPGQDWHPRL
jgi:hypothetical protein